MSMHDDYLARQSEANIIEPDHPCRNCGASNWAHQELSDTACSKFEPMTLSDLRDEEEDR